MSLSKEDWIKAGFRALSRGGPAAVKVEVIARDLGSTKGSFYWHFKDQAALKAAMLELWKSKATDDVITSLTNVATDAAKIVALVAAATEAPDDTFGGPEIEAAIRDWGRYDAGVRAAIDGIDAKRLDFVTSLFVGLSLDQKDAATRAALICSAYVGLLHRGALSNPIHGQGLSDFVRLLIP